ncbi:bifunctional methionine sulfoxide reductase B/A protein [Candidatus Solincola sp.]|jgi:peptide methionine sulfoxide reductase msrA/msrB|nr:bifunctional methionine sulfoxide reductase B/A protein [Actinomycetota bacterium]MDI7251937.1 bifunctional methionine sulfoxide reductase B/A protein [Actinomycetota bacterium]
MAWRKLTREEERIIVHGGTEPPFSGEYTDHFEPGTYTCRRCGAPLYRSEDKFHSGCGWPAFDDEIPGAVKRRPDPDGRRTEITCASCGAHLGHVFEGEGFTPKNVRHCVNSLSLLFVPAVERIILGGGCFWCTEAVFRRLPGVVSVTPGYAGGNVPNPTYRQVCSGKTGHAEVVLVEYDPRRISLREILEVFFACHDPTSRDRQGADVGTQYRSVVLYTTEEQGREVRDFIRQAATRYPRPVVTEVGRLEAFYPAEDEHLRYYERNQEAPYCQAVIRPKLEKLARFIGISGEEESTP